MYDTKAMRSGTGRPEGRAPLGPMPSRDDSRARKTMEYRREKRPKGRMPQR